ncbi:MAG: AraC family transcriptional regulator [Sneathiella sp.]
MNETEQRNKFKSLVEKLAPVEGMHDTALGEVKASRISEQKDRFPILYEPGIIFLASGAKRGFIGGRDYHYSADTYLVLSSALPWEVEVVEASEEEPCLGIFIPLSSKLVGSVAIPYDKLTTANEKTRTPAPLPRSIIATQLDSRMRDAAIRLAEILPNPVDAEILGTQIVREIIYLVLKGPQSEAVRALIGRDTISGRITEILHQMTLNPEQALSVPDMAGQAGMSVSAFHAAFKETTSMAPIQYQKAIRLHRAQALMTLDGLRVSEAAFEVGYASASQFSRDYRKLFGVPPSEGGGYVQTIMPVSEISVLS